MRAIVKSGLRPDWLPAVMALGNQPLFGAGGGLVLLSGMRSRLLPHGSPRFSYRVRWTGTKRAGRTTRTMVLSETRHTCRPDASSGSTRGPRVMLVPRYDVTGRNLPHETAPRTVVQEPGSCGEGTSPTPPPRGLLAMSPVPSASPDRNALLFSRAVESARRASAPASGEPCPRASRARPWHGTDPGAVQAGRSRLWPWP